MNACQKIMLVLLGLPLVLVAVAGCSNGDRPPIGQVTGVVTLNGQPAPGLGVMFSQSGFRSSSGVTNDRGEYELKYVKAVMGAVVGDHKVRIQRLTNEGAGPDAGRIPEKYDRETELTAKVEPGHNTINFALVSE